MEDAHGVLVVVTENGHGNCKGSNIQNSSEHVNNFNIKLSYTAISSKFIQQFLFVTVSK